jgi:hypothetical protein
MRVATAIRLVASRGMGSRRVALHACMLPACKREERERERRHIGHTVDCIADHALAIGENRDDGRRQERR